MKKIAYLFNATLLSYFLSFSSVFAQEAVCRVNGEIVQCPDWFTNNFWSIFIIMFTMWGLLMAFVIVTLWKIFKKANKPGWASIIPIYNAVVMFRIAGFSGWMVLLMCIPFVNFIVYIIVMNSFAKSFGKETGFVVGLVLLPIVFLPILAFGDATYNRS